MIKCLICNKEFTTPFALGWHIHRQHNISTKEYKREFGLLCRCIKCGKQLNCDCKVKHQCWDCYHTNMNGINNFFFGKRHTDKTKEILAIKCTEPTKQLWKDPEYRDKVIRGVSKPRPESFKREQSLRIKKWYEDNPKQRLLRSPIMRKSWQEGKIVSSNFACNESNLEKELFEFVREKDKKVKRKFTLRIGKRYFFPDIIKKDKKLIIEFFGDYWHCNPKLYKEDYSPYPRTTAKEIWKEDEERIHYLESQGYKVLVVWEDDYKNNQEEVKRKIIDFLQST
jgi:very-short-patch-repair endonuclease